MGKITIIDDILAPKDTITINYRGKEPYKIVGMMKKLFVSVMKIESKNVAERDSRWNLIADPHDFYNVFIAYREDDSWTKSYIRIVIQGAQSSKDRTGWIKIELKGFTKTEYEFSNFIQKTFWWFYNRTFYYKQKRNYTELAKDNIHQMRDTLMKTLGIKLVK